MNLRNMSESKKDYLCDDDLLKNILLFYGDPKNKKNFKKWKKGRANDIHRSKRSDVAGRKSNI